MIPLDNLYEWISGFDTSTVIYHFNPHGSKKIEDLQQINDHTRHMTFCDSMSSVPIICHDQEPLDWDLYASTNWQQVRDYYQRNWPVSVFLDPDLDEFCWHIRSKQNLASVTQTTCFDRHVLLHSEKHSHEVDRYASSGFEPAYWWSHAMLALDWYRYARHDTRLDVIPDRWQHDWNIYARAWSGTREYRLSMLDRMYHLDLVSSARISFCHHDCDRHFGKHNFRNQSLSIVNDLSNLPNTDASSDFSAKYDVNHYQSCAIDVVLETVFDDQRWHLTEKILRPIACGKPFLLASTPGALEYLRSYGFVTFNDLIDESYDSIVDPNQRLSCIVNEMQRISHLPPGRRADLFRALHQRARYNRDWFFNPAFASNIIQELKNNLGTAVDIVRQNHGTGHRWWQERKSLGPTLRRDMDQICDKIIHRETGTIRADVADLLRQCRRMRKR